MIFRTVMATGDAESIVSLNNNNIQQQYRWKRQAAT